MPLDPEIDQLLDGVGSLPPSTRESAMTPSLTATTPTATPAPDDGLDGDDETGRNPPLLAPDVATAAAAAAAAAAALAADTAAVVGSPETPGPTEPPPGGASGPRSPVTTPRPPAEAPQRPLSSSTGESSPPPHAAGTETRATTSSSSSSGTETTSPLPRIPSPGPRIDCVPVDSSAPTGETPGLPRDGRPESTVDELPEPRQDRESVGASEHQDKVTVLPRLLGQSKRGVSFLERTTTQTRRATMLSKQPSTGSLGSRPRSATTSEVDPIIAPQTPRGSPMRPMNKNLSPSRRRLTVGTSEISHHALERLGVNTDILKKEKGMKKLGISDVDIARSEELRRYSGIPLDLSPTRSKVELIFGFSREQLLRAKAMKSLGTSEQEVMDEYSRRISMLGVHETPLIQSIK